MQFFAKRSGLSLIEILVSIAIISILTSITFSGFSREQRKSLIRRIAEQLQVDLQAAQIKAQSAVAYTGGKLCTGSARDGLPCTVDTDCDISPGGTFCSGSLGTTCGVCENRAPRAYGIWISTAQVLHKYSECQDFNLFTAPPAPDGYCTGGSSEQYNIKTMPQYILFSFRYDGGATCSTCEPHIFFSVPSGNAIIQRSDLAPPPTTKVEILIRDTTTGKCYSVSVQKTSGTVGRRQLATGC